MEKSRKKIRICLLCVVLVAVVVGILYYYYDSQGNVPMSKGTLISNVKTGLAHLWR